MFYFVFSTHLMLWTLKHSSEKSICFTKGIHGTKMIKNTCLGHESRSCHSCLENPPMAIYTFYTEWSPCSPLIPHHHSSLIILFLKHIKHASNSEPLPWLLFLPRIISPHIRSCCTHSPPSRLSSYVTSLKTMPTIMALHPYNLFSLL